MGPLTIYKYELQLGATQLLLPMFSQVLDVQMQNGKICLWALQDPEAFKDVRNFLVCGTGGVLNYRPHEIQYLATVQDGQFVWHVFELK